MIRNMEQAITAAKEHIELAGHKIDEAAAEVANARQYLRDLEVLAERADRHDPEPSEVEAALTPAMQLAKAKLVEARAALDEVRAEAKRALRA